MRLSDAQIELYSRQIILREVGGTGQTRLLAARCIGIGRGPAYDAALSYLAGAGVATIHMLRSRAAAGERVLPFAPLEERCPDSTITTPAALDLSLDDYDIALRIAGDAAHEVPDLPAAGRPRVGSIAITAHPDGAIDLTLLPRDTGCLACCASRESARASNTEQAADAASLAAAGTLAALACCRWLTGIEPDPRSRTLHLGAGRAVWVEAPSAQRTLCPRGCPPMAEPV